MATIAQLYADGSLTGNIVHGVLRLDSRAVEKLEASSLPLATLAREAGTQSEKVKRVCLENDIPVMQAPRRNGPAQPYVERRNELKIRDLLTHGREGKKRNNCNSDNLNQISP